MKNFKITLSAAVFTLCFYAVNVSAADYAIFKYIKKNDVNAVKKAAGPKTINLKDDNANSPLLYAAQEAKKPEIIAALLEAGANTEERGKDGYSALMTAIRKNYMNPDIAVALINGKANVNAVFLRAYNDENKMTPLMYAVNEHSVNDAKVVRALVDAGANVEAKRAEDDGTPLLIAARYAKDPETINIIVKAGANIEERNKYGYTPLMMAIRKNESYPDIAIALIENKADVNAALNKQYDDEDKMTPLMYALSEYTLNKPKVIQALIDFGADVKAKNVKDGYTPLLFAARNAHETEIIDILIKAGSNIEEKDRYGYTPLMLALRKNDAYPDIAIALMKNKADVNAVFEDNRSTPLMMALGDYLATKPKVIQALIDFGADVNAKNIAGITPLMFAAKYSTEETVKILLKAGADLYVRDNYNKSATDYAKDNAKINQKDLKKLK